jgi:hypothetical protein
MEKKILQIRELIIHRRLIYYYNVSRCRTLLIKVIKGLKLMVSKDMDKHHLDVLIGEYMRDNGYPSSLNEFLQEANVTLPANNDSHPSDGHQDTSQSDLLVLFECGKREQFFNLWTGTISQSLRDGDPLCQNLEFCLAVYFALYPLRYKVGDAQSAMITFQSYLNSRGKSVELSPDLAVYCALPYVHDPSSHNSFQHLFTDSWNKELRLRLEQFLEASVVGVAPRQAPPTLLDLYRHYQGDDESHSREHSLRERLKELQASYHVVAGIAVELVEALENAVSGNPLNPDYIQDMCVRLFEASAPPTAQAPPTFHNKDLSTSILQTSTISLRQTLNTPLTKALPLDYSSLKKDLLILPQANKPIILQALRMRLANCPSVMMRQQILIEYISNDVISINGSDLSICQKFLYSDDENVMEQFCRFLNGISSLRCGRDYLQSNELFVQTLCTILTSMNEESASLQNLMGTIQKLSLRRILQSQMISCGLIEWTVNLLGRADKLSEYTLRYSLALLMNLCLRQEGKQRCVTLLPQPIHVLIDLIDHDNNEIRSYVNGILYSILELKEIRQVAIDMDLVDVLQSVMRESPPDLQGQLEFLLGRFQPVANGNDERTSEEETEEDHEADPDVIDGDENESPPATNEEDILKHYYLTTKIKPTTNHAVTGTTKPLNEPLKRLVTPLVGGAGKGSTSSMRPSSAQGRVIGHTMKTINTTDTSSSRPKTSLS